MGFLICKIEEIVAKIERNRAVSILFAMLFAIGVTIGLIISRKNCSCWWCQGRIVCIKTVLFKGFFAVFFRFLLNLLLNFAILCLLSLNCVTNYLKLVAGLAIGVFVGAYIKLAVGLYGMGGLICSLLLFLVLGLICLLATFISFNDTCRQVDAFTFAEVFGCNLPAIQILLVGFVYALIATFVIVRLFVVAV